MGLCSYTCQAKATLRKKAKLQWIGSYSKGHTPSGACVVNAGGTAAYFQHSSTLRVKVRLAAVLLWLLLC